MNALAWPDIVIGAVMLLAAYRGFTRGFIAELSGAVALAAALVSPWFYNGSFDSSLGHIAHLGPGSSHVLGMVLTGLIVYAIVIAAASVLNRFAKLPFVNVGNSAAGAVVGFAKGAILFWVILYVALFFPLSRDLRADLHRSHLPAYLTEPDAAIDRVVLATVPWFAKPVLWPYFKRHHV